MEKVKLRIVGLSYSQTQSGAYALVLGENKGKRRLPIIIGGFEAQAIAIQLEDMTPTRPLTHDLFKSFADSFKISIKEVLIYNLVEGIFYSKLLCVQDGKEIEIDARTSDAIALAVRFKCPIYTHEFILSSAGIVIEVDPEKAMTEMAKRNPVKPEKQKTFSELEELLKEALAAEDYEKASKLRDEIKERKKNEQ
ncbi:MAG: bifunctional DNase/RNase [Flavobacteriales bacterium]|jgi:bifunctional DNase/RNase